MQKPDYANVNNVYVYVSYKPDCIIKEVHISLH